MGVEGLLEIHDNLTTHHECEGGIEKSVPRITDRHQTLIVRGGFFYPVLTRIMDSFSFFSLYIRKKNIKKNFQKILNTPRCDMVTSFLHYNDVTDRRAASVRPTCGCSFFIFPTGWCRYVRYSQQMTIKA